MPLNRSGTKNAADTACTILPATSTPKVGAKAHTSEPVKNTACVKSTMRRASSHWITPAVIGVNAPITSKKPVVSHCTVVLSTPKSRINRPHRFQQAQPAQAGWARNARAFQVAHPPFQAAQSPNFQRDEHDTEQPNGRILVC